MSHSRWLRTQRDCARRRIEVICAGLLALWGPLGVVRADPPLHERIDQLVDASLVAPPAAAASDAEFVRRLYLNLTGKTPSAAEARVFLDSPSADKRSALIDQLLASPRYARHMANVFDVMWMERRPEKHVKSAEWYQYLVASFEANKPYNQLVQEILSADGADPTTRPAARFLLDRDADPHLLTRDVARMLFGRDLQCAQCHDHPLISDYAQADYYGLFAFFNRTSLYTDKKQKNLVSLAEKADGDVGYTSVFTKEAYVTGPRVPGGVSLDEPDLPPGEEYTVPPAKEVRSVPKFSRRAQLAALAGAGTSRAFQRNIVNRLWAQMMGRGLVEPVDLLSRDNPPLVPELLDMLAAEFVQMKFDIRGFLRELALTRTYQRSLDLPATLPDAAGAVTARLAEFQAAAKLAAEQAEQAFRARSELEKKLTAARKALVPIADELTKARAARAEAFKVQQQVAPQAAAAKAKLAAAQEAAQVLGEAQQAVAAALAKLPADPDLTAAFQQFSGKVQQAGEQLKAAQASADQKQQELAAAAGKLDTSRQQEKQVLDRFQAAHQSLQALQQQHAELAAADVAAQGRQTAAQQRVEDVPLVQGFADALAAASTARAARAARASELAAGRATKERLATEMPRLEQELAAARTAGDAAGGELAKRQTEAAQKEELVTLVSAAAAKSQVAKDKLASDTQLAETVAKLQARSNQLQQDLAAARQAVDAQQKALQEAQARLSAGTQALETARQQSTECQTRLPQLESQMGPAEESARAADARLAAARATIAERWSRRNGLSVLAPMTPEQLAWSMLEATGILDRQRAASRAELDKQKPLPPTADAAQQAERARAVEIDAFDKLAGNVPQFVTLFGAGPGQNQRDFFATADQALFLANGGVLLSWLAPGGGNLTDRLLKIDDPGALADELYLSVLTRRPAPEEVEDVRQYLAARPQQKAAAVQELAWALLTSAEFRFNH